MSEVSYTPHISHFKGWGQGLKIFYAVQATGNGHIARAMELMPYLQQYGEVDVFLSGSNSSLAVNLPVKYRSKGISLFYNANGGLAYCKTISQLQPARVWKEAHQLPLEKYDIIINDFESITSLACKIKKLSCINFGHQASFQSPETPRPSRKDAAGEFILKNYAAAAAYIGLHFEAYDNFIYPPVIKGDILSAVPVDDNHITVYLSHYNDRVVANQLQKLKNLRFQVFSKQVKRITPEGNITFIPVSNEAFNKSMIKSCGIITGAGFETPAEALYMGKKLLCLPIKGQYEQSCNAAALEKFGVPIIKTIDDFFPAHVEKWLQAPQPSPLRLTHSTYDIVQIAIEKARSLSRKDQFQGNPLTEKEIFATI
ncbi:glycosyltransferase family protein [Foetidibacter luteolus]|uniref:glycosyltransferase family protein n=1 Tax=Foetidibacter luteolus TaxID=2608880 RepID=UPI00129A0C83|nr:glycosyltransferase family protein [Foetidibacter luteolus]